MKVYVIYDQLEPVKVCWTAKQAGEKASPGDIVKGVELAPFNDLVDAYSAFRTYKEPNAQEAFLFLVSEIGELADELAHGVGSWVRNNHQDKGKGVEGEIGDVLMMLTTLATALHLDPLRCMENKMRSKGFK
jgi:NTP pyrophosphatase (non-canonical NTP hydrolase)